MVQTRKFSQFEGPDTIQETDIVVGLRNGMNWQFTGISAGGGGGSGGVTMVINQAFHGLAVGDWVRVNSAGLYVRGIANTPENSDVIGVVILVPSVNQFTLQQSGYITASQGVFTGLVTGDPYYLNTDIGSPGSMTNVDALVDGEVSRPLFIPDSDASGWIVPYRGIIVGGGPNTNSGQGDGGTDSNITTVVQNGHGFSVGDVIRQSAANTILMQPVYVWAYADTPLNSRAIGVVIEVINPNQFRVQFSGYCLQTGSTGGITVDDLGSVLVSGVTYFLSIITPGKVSAVEPPAGWMNKPVYVCEQTIADTGLNAGWILDQRPLRTPVDANIISVFQPGHGFSVEHVVRVLGNGTYTLAQANNLTNARAVGIVIRVIDGSNFILQTEGFSDIFAGKLPAQTYFLSDTTPGLLTVVEPADAGNFSKPMLVAITPTTGYILEQRPMMQPNANGGGGGGGGSSGLDLIDSYTFVGGETEKTFTDIFGAPYVGYIFKFYELHKSSITSGLEMYMLYGPTHIIDDGNNYYSVNGGGDITTYRIMLGSNEGVIPVFQMLTYSGTMEANDLASTNPNTDKKFFSLSGVSYDTGGQWSPTATENNGWVWRRSPQGTPSTGFRVSVTHGTFIGGIIKVYGYK